MSFSVAGVLSALGSVAGSSGGIAGQTGWLGYSSAKSLNKKTLEQQSAAQLALDEQLSKEGPSWSVEGLRKAGINPILAANGGNLGATTSSLSGSFGSGSIGSYPNPLSDYFSAKNMALQNKLLDKSADKLEAEIEEIRSRIPKNEVEAANKFETGGLTGNAGFAHKVGVILGNLIHNSKTADEAKKDINTIHLDDGRNHGVEVGPVDSDTVRSIESVFAPHSAKRLEQHKKDLEQMKKAHRRHH